MSRLDDWPWGYCRNCRMQVDTHTTNAPKSGRPITRLSEHKSTYTTLTCRGSNQPPDTQPGPEAPDTPPAMFNSQEEEANEP